MSIGRLLAAGKSLVGVQNASSRYRMDRRTRLPKFGSPKNPFAPEERKPAPPQPGAAQRTTLSAKSTKSVVPATPPAANPIPAAPTRLSQAVQRLREWCVEANPIPGRAGPARSAITPMSRCTGAPIQSELSLDEVRVVRNDLSDADLEIVPAKAVRRAEATSQSEESAWSRLTTRIFVREEHD